MELLQHCVLANASEACRRDGLIQIDKNQCQPCIGGPEDLGATYVSEGPRRLSASLVFNAHVSFDLVSSKPGTM